VFRYLGLAGVAAAASSGAPSTGASAPGYPPPAAAPRTPPPPPTLEIDPAVAAMMRRMNALTATIGSGLSEGSLEQAGVNSRTGGAPMSESEALASAQAVEELWSSLAGIAPSSEAPPVTLGVPGTQARGGSSSAVSLSEGEEGADTYGWGSEGSNSVSAAASKAEQPVEHAVHQPPRAPVAAQQPAPVVKKDKKQAVPPAPARPNPASPPDGDDGDSSESAWPWSIGLDHRAKERAAGDASAPPSARKLPLPPSSAPHAAPPLPMPPGPPLDGVGAKLLRKMGWSEEDAVQADHPNQEALKTVTPRPERLGLGVATPADKAAAAAAAVALESASGGNAQKKVALMMASSSTKAGGSQSAWEGADGEAIGDGGAAPPPPPPPPDSWETGAGSPATAAVAAARPRGAAAADAGLKSMRSLLMAHLRGLEDALEVSIDAAIGDDALAQKLFPRLEALLALTKGSAWRGLTAP